MKKEPKSDMKTMRQMMLEASTSIDWKKLRKHWASISRKHLKANKIPTKGLTDQDCIFLANQHMRAFLGMDRPNVFTNNGN